MPDRELMQMALASLEGYARNCRCEGGGSPCDAAEALRERLAQPEPEHSEAWWKHEVSNAFANGYEKGRASIKQPKPEPVAWYDKHGMITHDPFEGVTPLYTAPPQREWQGLTDGEIAELWVDTEQRLLMQDFARAIEAKLKEKNT